MLSDREREELGLIEQGLRDDSRFAASFGHRRRPPLHLRRWFVRTAVAVGLLIALCGLVVGAVGLFLQGILLAGPCCGWWLWRGRRDAARWAGGADQEVEPGPGSGRSTEPA
jgi:Protein of unknown function (DUF3040)